MTFFDVPEQNVPLIFTKPDTRHVDHVSEACDDYTGWSELITELHRHLSYLSPDYEVFQIKEKFGGLRYYANYVSRAGETVEQQTVGNQIFRRLIDETERRSWHHCMTCSEQADLYESSSGWRYVSCLDHVRGEDDVRVRD
jgi:hypothetical protein